MDMDDDDDDEDCCYRSDVPFFVFLFVLLGVMYGLPISEMNPRVWNQPSSGFSDSCSRNIDHGLGIESSSVLRKHELLRHNKKQQKGWRHKSHWERWQLEGGRTQRNP
ncbi:uncharacterized protein BO66DRAFT_30896 [Aspergillus aculeatinus CBS 121060]|uniref:Uncharacterized protein n=1 Tax=Aspergillus aculeatinus CBS 121060 TaxID=1448322 RepID=A0ACD1HG04_9EURO|nr:hypothetical protein BO66DRAFT_30896 [Aspergillus aculeatinus CBS 121060]RAH72296.1 hypothetical protein BO66DRAFT_30896 [Aspergillus aculeatinus CBS 121060]